MLRHTIDSSNTPLQVRFEKPWRVFQNLENSFSALVQFTSVLYNMYRNHTKRWRYTVVKKYPDIQMYITSLVQRWWKAEVLDKLNCAIGWHLQYLWNVIAVNSCLGLTFSLFKCMFYDRSIVLDCTVHWVHKLCVIKFSTSLWSFSTSVHHWLCLASSSLQLVTGKEKCHYTSTLISFSCTRKQRINEG